MAINGNKYGHLYNFYAVGDPRNIAPEGWHGSTNDEWSTLENYLIANGGNYEGTASENKIVKSMAITSGWLNSTYEGAIGNNPLKNNSTGFYGLPGGYRS